MCLRFDKWDPATADPAMICTPDEVRIWTVVVPLDRETLEANSRVLSLEERERFLRFRDDLARRQFVCGRHLLRRILGKNLGVEATELAFEFEPHGKPFLRLPAGNHSLQFNLSHSGGLVAIAMAYGRKIGIDIEKIQPLSNVQELEKSIFSKHELVELHSLPPSFRLMAFYHAWTRKEAYLKATGDGLTGDFQSVEVVFSPGQDPAFQSLPPGSPGGIGRWKIRAIPLPPGFTGAVVFETMAEIKS